MSAVDLVEYAATQRSLGRLEGELGQVRRAFEAHTQQDAEAFSNVTDQLRGMDRKLTQLVEAHRLAESAGRLSGTRWGAAAGAFAAGILTAVGKLSGLL